MLVAYSVAVGVVVVPNFSAYCSAASTRVSLLSNKCHFLRAFFRTRESECAAMNGRSGVRTATARKRRLFRIAEIASLESQIQNANIVSRENKSQQSFCTVITALGLYRIATALSTHHRLMFGVCGSIVEDDEN